MLLVKICMKVEIRALRALAGECWSHQARAQKENITYVFVILLFSSYCPCFRLFAAFEPPSQSFLSCFPYMETRHLPRCAKTFVWPNARRKTYFVSVSFHHFFVMIY